ncbi:hypothetical protein GLOIN_2v1763192 [Rhizophagus irregularis DAOM 181602=DAOM 197198]|uniref:Uncharacterized protein n=2 Tax=Rhizophagus irregularis TaxID=588596 RepID=A0A2P4QVD2_RHIID|nr:hypothetical protein GLOIN_2v1763192 [Rhizophagus irregularis DAOM 181602=DAOM 197198]POG81606.1 hypothetical protein GLOIN_2v1763192 [Rhizophagus irregularis DAOM 181602=DAOM 197198]|eukprot:XP_025188472.1 hypothetical protein GLOIN_2v1763192 [Rhizophagus irregularis DAOM 181602=DAOM 197198]
MSNKEKPHVVIPTLVPELELEKEVSVLGKELNLGVEPYEANDLDGCKTLFHDLELNDPEVVHLPILKELESEGGPEPKTQLFRKAVKRRAIAVHRAKVLKFHPDNSSDIRKMLKSKRKQQFREILEKEFDKREQFKFALCSLTKFLIDDKPGNEKQGKKNLRTDWLKNKQIIVYNRNEIDDYLSNAFEQILYQVEEKGGKSNT